MEGPPQKTPGVGSYRMLCPKEKLLNRFIGFFCIGSLMLAVGKSENKHTYIVFGKMNRQFGKMNRA